MKAARDGDEGKEGSQESSENYKREGYSQEGSPLRLQATLVE